MENLTPREFCYLLQGLFELQDPKTLDEKQTKKIKENLNRVFDHQAESNKLEPLINPGHGHGPGPGGQAYRC